MSGIGTEKPGTVPWYAELLPQGWLRHWIITLTEFVAYQGLVQILTGLTGILIIHALSKQEYALYAVSNGLQSVCNLLADIGITIGVMSIGGRVYMDRSRFGQLINTALALRGRLALASIAICAPVALWMLLRNGASILGAVLLCAIMVATVVPQLGASIWQISPQLHSQFRRIQSLDLGGAALRTGLIGVLTITHINAVLASTVTLIGNCLRAFFLRRWSEEKADPQTSTHPDDKRELLALTLKQLPNTIFFCFEGQITLFIMSYFGNTANIADLTAAGRVAALLTVLSTTFTNVIAPRYARTTGRHKLMRLYLVSLVGTAGYVAPLVWFSWKFPNPLLYLLGSKYASMRNELVWVMLTAALGQLTLTSWTLNCTRAWIRMRMLFYIPTILVVQTAAAICLDLHHLHGIVLFGLATTAAPLPIYLSDAWWGMGKEKV